MQCKIDLLDGAQEPFRLQKIKQQWKCEKGMLMVLLAQEWLDLVGLFQRW